MIKHPLYPRGNVYLSGGMEHAENDGAGWRKFCSKVLRDMKYFPIDITALDTEYKKENGDLYNLSKDPEHILERKANIRKHFIYTDLQLVMNDSDAVVVLYDESVRRGAGTISECQVAFLHDIPVFLVSMWENWCDEVPGWLVALTTKIFTDFDKLYAYLDQLPPGILKRDIYGNRHSGQHYLCSLSGEPFRKTKTHFVSKISPLYSKESVEVVKKTNEEMKDRYEFFVEHLEEEARRELLSNE